MAKRLSLFLLILFLIPTLASAQVRPDQQPTKAPEPDDAIYTQEKGALRKILLSDARKYFLPIVVPVAGVMEGQAYPDMRGAIVADTAGQIFYLDSAGVAFKLSHPSSWPYHVQLEEMGLLNDHPSYPVGPWGSDDQQEVDIDMTQYIQAAVDSAAKVGGKVLLPPRWLKVTGTITVPQGVVIEGTTAGKYGVYSTPYQPWRNSGTLVYFDPPKGGQTCFLFTTTDSYEARVGGLRDLTIMGAGVQAGSRAIEIAGDGVIMSSALFSNVHVHGFRDGVGLYLHAENGGGVTYGRFEQLRFRDCDTSVWLKATGGNGGGFVSTNTFDGLFISGGDIDYGILLEATPAGDPTADCNHNRFMGGSIEPQYSRYGHIVLRGGAWAIFDEVRVEATQQFAFYPEVAPVQLDSFAAGTKMSLLYGGEVENTCRGCYLELGTPEAASPWPNGVNVLDNSALTGLMVDADSGRYFLPSWQIGWAEFSSSLYTLHTGDSIRIEELRDPDLPKGIKGLRFHIPKGRKLRLVPQGVEWQRHRGKQFTVHALVRSTHAHASQWVIITAPGGSNTVVGSDFNRDATGRWTSVGGTFDNPLDNESFLAFLVVYGDSAANPGVDTMVVDVALPTLAWGRRAADGAGYISKAGGTMNGVLGLSVQGDIIDIADPLYSDTSGNTTRLFLPTDKTVFRITASQPKTIQSINVAEGAASNNPADWGLFPGGAMITLIVDGDNPPTNITLQPSAYLKLANGRDWRPKLGGESITLVADPNVPVVWYEVGRQEVAVNYGAADIDFGDPAYQDNGNQYNLLVPNRVNYVRLTGAGSGTIRYISQVGGYRDPGEMLAITNISGQPVTFDYPFVETLDSADLALPSGSTIFLMQTATTGVWREVARTYQPWRNKGAVTIDASTSNEGTPDKLYIPPGYAYAILSGGTTVINRINQAAANRRPEGDLLVLENGSASTVTLNPPYIAGRNDDMPAMALAPGQKAILMHQGVGIWVIMDVVGAPMDWSLAPRLHLVEDTTSAAEVQHYRLREGYVGGALEYINGIVLADFSGASSDIIIPLATGVNLYKYCKITISSMDATGDGLMWERHAVWGYNGIAPVVHSPFYVDAPGGNYGGAQATIQVTSSGINLQIYGINEATNMKVVYEIY